LRLLAGCALACAVVVACDSPTTPTGVAALSTTDVKAGSGAEAVAGSSVSMHYTLWLYDGAKADHKGVQIETSTAGNPIAFTLGSGAVIKGWEQGITGMKVGGIRRLVIPPSLGYGSERHNSIPPYSTLIFDVELLSVG
jgi:FKBP-type peptidyl-prolyl cis-trans isomerase